MSVVTDTSYDMEMRVVIDTYVTDVSDTSYDVEMRVVIDTYVTVVTCILSHLCGYSDVCIASSVAMEMRGVVDSYVAVVTGAVVDICCSCNALCREHLCHCDVRCHT